MDVEDETTDLPLESIFHVTVREKAAAHPSW
jgi:hypothetical protein